MFFRAIYSVTGHYKLLTPAARRNICAWALCAKTKMSLALIFYTFMGYFNHMFWITFWAVIVVKLCEGKKIRQWRRVKHIWDGYLQKDTKSSPNRAFYLLFLAIDNFSFPLCRWWLLVEPWHLASYSSWSRYYTSFPTVGQPGSTRINQDQPGSRRVNQPGSTRAN